MGIFCMHNEEQKIGRRGFFKRLMQTGLVVAAGGMALTACKCGDEEVNWSDQDDSSKPKRRQKEDKKEEPKKEPPPKKEDES